ncbi:YIP1 family protein [uncultured Desulfovibrio sp.]|uniref:YIP1 family protein n=1 Tax=uncultured Desulfovibrio sp. TaxID=167968 RepID=UPI00262E759C|nr:YIP1 family protein [uncultured Desulfovibrio sp.]
MNIICPQCGFSRPFPPDRAPAHSVIATCPQCSCRFRFHPQDGSSELLDPVRPQAAPASTDLPPGAVIPGGEDEERGAPCRRESCRDEPREELPPFRPRDSRDTDEQDEGPGPDREEDDLADEAQEDGDRPGLPSGNPWEMAPAPSGWLVAFYRTSMRIMFGAPAFFTCLRPHRRSLRALGFYLIVSIVFSAVQLLWLRGMTNVLVEGGLDPQMQQMLLNNPLINESMFLFMLKQVAFVTLQLYAQSALLYLMFRLILRDKPEFDLIFQVSAYGSAPILLCVIPVLGSLTGIVWSLACSLIGYKTVLRLDWGQTLLGYAPVFLLEFFLLLQMIR